MIDRMERVSELLRTELGQMLQADAETLGIVDIVDIEVSRDLSSAKVYLAAITPSPEMNLLQAVAKRAGDYAHQMGKRLNLKRIPHFEFFLDTHSEEINRVETILDSLDNKSNE